MSILMGFIFTSCVAIFFTVHVHAQTVSTINTNQVVEEVKTEKKLGLSVATEYSTNMRKNSSPDQDNSTSFILLPNYQISEKSNLSARLDIIQNHNTENRTNLSNLLVVYNPRTLDISKELNLTPEVAAVLPTDQVTREDESYRGGISLRPTLVYSPEKLPSLKLTNRVSVTKSFHEFEVKRNFSANTEYSLRYRLVLDLDLSKKLHLQLLNDFAKAWTYNGYTNDAFYFAQELSYELHKKWSVYIRHKNEGSMRGPNNNGDNVDVFNSKSSYVSLGVSHIF